MELTCEGIDKEIKRKFINKLNRNCKNGLVKLEESNVKHRETLGLLNQSYNTIRNAEMNLKKYNFVDANSLLRAALEYMIMAVMIEEDERIFNEFVILPSIDNPLKRKYTIVNTLICKFAEKIKDISTEIFEESTSKDVQNLFIEVYDLLCKYTHASLVVSIFKEITMDEEKEILKLLMSYVLYFVKIILLDTIIYLNNGSGVHITVYTLVGCMILNWQKISLIINKNNVDMKKITKLLYWDTVNNELFKSFNKKLKDLVSDEMNSIDRNDIVKFMDNFISS